MLNQKFAEAILEYVLMSNSLVEKYASQEKAATQERVKVASMSKHVVERMQTVKTGSGVPLVGTREAAEKIVQKLASHEGAVNVVYALLKHLQKETEDNQTKLAEFQTTRLGRPVGQNKVASETNGYGVDHSVALTRAEKIFLKV